MNLKHRQTLLTVIAIGVVALFLLDRALFTPLAASWRKRADRITELRTAL